MSSQIISRSCSGEIALCYISLCQIIGKICIVPYYYTTTCCPSGQKGEVKQEGNVLQEPAAEMHLMFIWGCSKFSLILCCPRHPCFNLIWLLYGHFPTITISCLRYPSELIDTYKRTNVQMSRCPQNTIHVTSRPRKSPFQGNHHSPEVTFPGKSNFPRIHLSREIDFQKCTTHHPCPESKPRALSAW